MSTFISPFTDFGFKRLFGEEANKELVINFLNELLVNELGENSGNPIRNVQYLKTEMLGNTKLDRKAVFDLYCELESGEKIIVELQKAKQNFFKDRSVFYSTFPIQQQAIKGDWDYKLKAVYTVGILDFIFEESRSDPGVVHTYRPYLHNVKLMEVDRKQVFYDKLSLIYLEMPKFKKTEDELETHFDKWLYLIKNLSQLTSRPAKLQDRIFSKLFDVAELEAFTRSERDAYEQSLKYYRDLNNVIDTARDEALQQGHAKGLEQGLQQGLQQGLEKGLEQGRLAERLAIALELKQSGYTSDQIRAITKLSEDEVESL